MKIVFTGGGTGGHFYPIIAVVEAMRDIMKDQKLIEPEMYFLAPDPYNKGMLFDQNITYKKVMAGKIRRYASIWNFFDVFKLAIGTLKAIWTVFWIYPDIIVSKGGYGSVPVVTAGRLLGIPILIHESDSKPGRANLYAGKFATKIAVSYPEAGKFFNSKKVAWTGNPVRQEILLPVKEGAHKYLELDENVPVLFVLGGSQGAQRINEVIIDALPELIKKYQIIHQTGTNNYNEVTRMANVGIGMSEYRARYKPFAYLNDLAMRMSAGAADLVITRAGSTLFEIANWHIPSIIIPINQEVSHDQHSNAFTYARNGAGAVIEENNLTDTVLMNEIERILENKDLYNDMVEGTKEFSKPEAAKLIAREIFEIMIKHEK